MICLSLTGLKEINFKRVTTQETLVTAMSELVQAVGCLASLRKIREDSFLLNYGIQMMADQLTDRYDLGSDDEQEESKQALDRDKERHRL